MTNSNIEPHGQVIIMPAWTIAAAIGAAAFLVVLASIAAMQLTRSVYTEGFEAGFYRGQALPGSKQPHRKLVTDRLPQTPVPSTPKAKP